MPLWISIYKYSCEQKFSFLLGKYLERELLSHILRTVWTLNCFPVFQFGYSVQSLSRVWLFATPWITAWQASLSINNYWNSLRLTSIESVMPFSHLIHCSPLLFLPLMLPSIRVFSNESTLPMRWPKYRSFSFSIIPSKKCQGWSPLEWTGWISLQSKGLSRVFSNTTAQEHQFFLLSFLQSPTLTSIHDQRKNHSLE